MNALPTQPGQNSEPVQLGQQKTQHHGVKVRRLRRRAQQSHLAVGNGLNRVGFLAQSLGDQADNVRVVFYDQKSLGRLKDTSGWMWIF